MGCMQRLPVPGLETLKPTIRLNAMNRKLDSFPASVMQLFAKACCQEWQLTIETSAAAYLKRVPCGRIHFIFSRWQHANKSHVAASVDLQNGMHGDDAATRITHQAPKEGDVPPAHARS